MPSQPSTSLTPLNDEALAILERLGSPVQRAARLNAAYADIVGGRTSDALPVYRDALNAARRDHEIRLGAHALLGMAALTAARSDLPRAARLLGAGEAILNSSGVVAWWMDDGLRDRAWATLSARTSANDLAALVANGRGLSLDEAAELALDQGAEHHHPAPG